MPTASPVPPRPRRVRLPRSMRLPRGVRLPRMPVLPTLLTIGNGICGLASISYAATAVRGSGDDPSLFYASLFIFAAMVFDSLDGAVARWTHQTTKFGGELDSLCDAISFGVAPALILLQVSDAYPARLLWVIAALFMTCTLLRLARFNVEAANESSHDWFSGLPSPAAAATVASFMLVATNDVSPLLPDSARRMLLSQIGMPHLLRDVLPLIAIALAGLMVSRVRYPHVVHQALHSKHHFRQLAQIVFAIAAIVALGELSAPLIISAFVLFSPLRAAYQRLRGPKRVAERAAERLDPAGAENLPETLVVGERKRLKLWWPTRRGPRRRA